MDIAAVKATIAAGVRASREAAATVARVLATGRDAYPYAAATLHGSGHEDALAGLLDLRAGVREAELVTDLLTAVREGAERYTARLG